MLATMIVHSMTTLNSYESDIDILGKQTKNILNVIS